jgi:hypothetical protein
MQAAPQREQQRGNHRAAWRDPHATLYRLRYSQHVGDLRFISLVALVLLIIAVILLLRSGLPKLILPVATVFGAVLAWAYQTGSARLGVVDLFACEISTLCRVVILVRTAHRLIEDFTQGPPSPKSDVPAASRFVSEEDYFPVFESNNRDLQVLEANVVIHITEFYTYMKAVRDSLRARAEVKPDSVDFDSPSNKGDAAGPWHTGTRNVIYTLFLGLESARYALSDLVEFEPERAERRIVILLSELEAWGFLRTQFDEEDILYKRIMLRVPQYQQLVPDLISSVEIGVASEKRSTEAASWEQARVLLDELKKRYGEVMRNLPEGGR